MEEIGPEEFEKQLKANEVLYLLLYSPTDTHTAVCISSVLTTFSSGLKPLSQERVEKASSVLLGSPPVYMSSSDKLAARLHIGTTSLPALLVFKDGDADRPAGQWQLKASHNADDIKLWLLRYDSGHHRTSRIAKRSLTGTGFPLHYN